MLMSNDIGIDLGTASILVYTREKRRTERAVRSGDRSGYE